MPGRPDDLFASALEPLSHDDLRAAARRALDREGGAATGEAVGFLVDVTEGDARAALTTREVALALAGDEEVALAHVEGARSTRALRHREDDHDDVASAFVESIRGSGPARRPLPRRPVHRPRGGLRLSSRRPQGLGSPGAPASRDPGPTYYEPSAHGEEPAIEERMRAMRTDGGAT